MVFWKYIGEVLLCQICYITCDSFIHLEKWNHLLMQGQAKLFLSSFCCGCYPANSRQCFRLCFDDLKKHTGENVPGRLSLVFFLLEQMAWPELGGIRGILMNLELCCSEREQCDMNLLYSALCCEREQDDMNSVLWSWESNSPLHWKNQYTFTLGRVTEQTRYLTVCVWLHNYTAIPELKMKVSW